MIGNITVLNLPHRTDRKYYMIGHLETIGAPLDRIQFYPAKFGKDYESVKQILNEMEADGIVLGREVSFDIRLTQLCYLWNWLVILRDFAEKSHDSIVMLDDRILTLEWNTLEEIVNHLHRSRSPFHILQLGWAPLWKGERKQVEPVTGFVARGARSNGDYATVFSPTGARWLFDQIKEGCHSPEALFFRLSQSEQNTIDGIFHCIDSQVTDAKLQFAGDIFND